MGIPSDSRRLFFYKHHPFFSVLVSEPGFFQVSVVFPVKPVRRLVFEIQDRSHGGDLVEDTISTFLMTSIDPETDPEMTGMLGEFWFGSSRWVSGGFWGRFGELTVPKWRSRRDLPGGRGPGGQNQDFVLF